MSKHRINKIVCPKCGCRQEFLVWENINAYENPELKPEVITGDIFKCTCHDCGAVHILGYDFLYNDPEENYMLYLVHNDEGVTKALQFFNLLKNGKIHEEVGSVGKDYRMRVVKTLPELIEKIAVFRCGLDDRIIMVIKAFYAMSYSEQKGEPADNLYFTVNESGKKMILFYKDKKETASIEISQKLYDTIKNQYMERVEDADAFIIDFDWAVSLLTEEL